MYLVNLYKIYLDKYDQWLRGNKGRPYIIYLLEIIIFISLIFVDIKLGRGVSKYFIVIFFIITVLFYPFIVRTSKVQKDHLEK